MPLHGALRERWIEIIEKHQPHQQIGEILTYVYVCSLHFEPSCILKSKKLKIGSSPTIFWYDFEFFYNFEIVKSVKSVKIIFTVQLKSSRSTIWMKL